MVRHVGGRMLVPPELSARADALLPPGTWEVRRVDMRLGASGDPTRRALVASYGDIKKARRLGYGSFAFLEHGIGQSYNGDRGSARHPSYSGGMDRRDVGLFLVPNDHAATAWEAAYPNAAVRTVASPRLARLPAREPGPGPVVAVSFHVNFAFSPETRTTWPYYRPAMADLARAFRVIGHAHPRWSAQMRRDYDRLGIEFVEDFAAVCRRADVYVCDNSSTLYEFASTGRPVVVLNAPWYRRHIDHGLRFWEAATVGVQVDAPGDLEAGVRLALSDPPTIQADRRAALGVVYTSDADAAEAVLDWSGDGTR